MCHLIILAKQLIITKIERNRCIFKGTADRGVGNSENAVLSIFHKLIIIVLRITVLRGQEDNFSEYAFFPHNAHLWMQANEGCKKLLLEIGDVPVSDTQAIFNGLCVICVTDSDLNFHKSGKIKGKKGHNRNQHNLFSCCCFPK